MNFSVNFSILNLFFNSHGIRLSYHYTFKKSNMNKDIRTTKCLRKLKVSTPLNSLAFNEAIEYARVFLDGTTSLFAIHIGSIGPYNKLFTMRTTKTGKKIIQ